MINSHVISSGKVEGSSVYNSKGDKLGSINDLMIDKYSGHVRCALLEFGGFLAIGTDSYLLPWSMLKYNIQFEGYVVPVEKSQLETAPRYSANETPDYSDEYGRNVYNHYGVNWM